MDNKIKVIIKTFLEQAKTGDLKTSNYPREYSDLLMKVSFGQGNNAKIPWISFLGPNQTTSNGIYPVYLYFKNYGKLILAYGISETNVPILKWNISSDIKTVHKYFGELNIDPERYGSSYVFGAYDINSNIDWDKVEIDLSNIIKEYKQLLKPNDMIPELTDALNSDIIQEYLNDSTFYFLKAQEKLIEFDNYNEPSTGFYSELYNKFTKVKVTYTDFIEQLDNDSEEYDLIILLAKLISYCDKNAADKNSLNEYTDKRTIARSGVRQTDWVKSLLNYKINNNNVDVLPPSIKNAITYLKIPNNGLTMLSENHREMVARNLLKINYDKEKFVEQLKEYFKPYNFYPKNPDNLTRIISHLLYLSTALKNLWLEKVEGLVVCDNTGWIDDAIMELSKAKSIVLWWDKSPTGGQGVINLLEETILNSEEKCIYIYFTINQMAYCRARIIDLSLHKEYEEKEWNKDSTPANYHKNFNDYNSPKDNGKTSKAKILFLSDSIEKLKISIPVSSFKFYKDYQPPTQNNMQPYSSINEDIQTVSPLNKPEPIPFEINSPINDITLAGLIINKQMIIRYVSSLLTKPFVILTGLSGSGKTKLAQAFAKWICENELQYCLVPVGADWTNREPLLGFPNALKPGEYVKPDIGVLALIINANNDPDNPYFLILDEMNLSHVERYFADFLSVMESNSKIPLHDGEAEWNNVPAKIKLPKNLFIIGTVNIDETTYMFSPKVLDRANVIEFRVKSDEMKNFLDGSTTLDIEQLELKGANMANSFVMIAKDKSLKSINSPEITATLINFFNELKKTGAEFGYRSASEIMRFAAILNKIEPGWSINEIIDIAVMQKLLPKVHGSRKKLEGVLLTLAKLCVEDSVLKEKDFKVEILLNSDKLDSITDKFIYPISFEKISRMYKGLLANGFTSYAEA